MTDWKRTHTCSQLRPEHIGNTVTLNGWVNNWRDHGNLFFIDLRDRYGMTQIVFNAGSNKELHDLATTLRSEWVVSVQGEVIARNEGQNNPKLATGQIEVLATKLNILSKSETPPFELTGESDEVSEDLRLRYRYLDLRRPKLQQAMILRHNMCRAMREYFYKQGFLEIETPMLGKSTPEGARDYLVPSRVHPGKMYALPQSPQLYKQILIVAGYDKYFQIARCFRDEDLRANRQPEFTQVDVEMGFVDQEDVIRVMEGLCVTVTKELKGIELETPFPRLTYHEAMERFGTDRPDLRFEMELVDITELAHQTEFQVFTNSECVRGMNAKQAAAKYSRKDIDALTKFVGEYGARGLAWAKVENGALTGSIGKFFADQLKDSLLQKMNAEDGDLLLFVADKRSNTNNPLNALRNRLGKELELYDPSTMHYSWCVDFPMFEKDEETGNWVAMHHPFTALHDEDWERLESDPGSVRAKAHDLIINGEEAGGGTIRIHRTDLQERILKAIGLSDEQAKERFGFLLDALKFGAPPHGGIALGLDRWVMLFAGLDNIRDVIAFPKTQRAMDMMSGAPGVIETKQLEELELSFKEQQK